MRPERQLLFQVHTREWITDAMSHQLCSNRVCLWNSKQIISTELRRIAFTKALEHEGWHVDTNLEDLSATETPLENFTGSAEEREHEMHRRLKSIGHDFHRALILKISHIGGHKYAGNVIVCTSSRHTQRQSDN